MKLIDNIPYGGEKGQELRIYLPDEGGENVFVYFHGGGIEGGDYTMIDIPAEYLTKKGIAVVSCNYRMYPDAQYPDFVKDAALSVAWVSKNIGAYGGYRNIYVGGSSAGAYLSMLLCFDKRYLAAYDMSPLDICGFIHDDGQPTVHFNVLRESGLDQNRVIIDGLMSAAVRNIPICS